jgi:hypothetical protein
MLITSNLSDMQNRVTVKDFHEPKYEQEKYYKRIENFEKSIGIKLIIILEVASWTRRIDLLLFLPLLISSLRLPSDSLPVVLGYMS